MLEVKNLFSFLIGLIAVLAMTGYLSRVAERLGLMDHPDPRKFHDRPIPLIGGVLIFIAVCASLILVPDPVRPFLSLVAGMGVLLATGLVDDAGEISPAGKLVMQTIAAVLMVSWGEVQITNLGGVFGYQAFELQEWAIPFTVLCTLFLINAINMLDGLDGLAGLVSVVILGWLLALGLIAGINAPALSAMLAVLGAVVGFLIFNLRFPWQRRAKIFMGDSGSMMVGFAIAWFAVYLSQNAELRIYPATIAWVVALPVVDLLALYIRRIASGKSPFLPDREHIHHRLLAKGLAVTPIVLLVAAVTCLSGLIGFLGWFWRLPEIYLMIGLILMLVGYMWGCRLVLGSKQEQSPDYQG